MKKELLKLWKEFKVYWYDPLRCYPNIPLIPDLEDFMEWLEMEWTENSG